LNFAIVAAVFPIIFIGELPDKTMFASLVMSTRGKPFAVWVGAAGAFAVHVVIATTVGVALFHLVPHRVLDGIVALLFLAGAVLAIREASKAQQEEGLVEKEAASGRRVVVTAFIVIFLA
jgi:putative Ca2+/H+ antiporter (TMEM165/GDT1 family)